jgi:hypothetical protein
MTGVSHAQTVTLSSLNFASLSPTSFGTAPAPVVTTTLSGSNGGTISGGTIGIGGVASIIIPDALRLSYTSGVGTTLGTNTASIDFNVDAVTVTALVPFNYSVSTSNTLISPQTTLVTSGLNIFRIDIDSWGGALPANTNNAVGLTGKITFVGLSSAPEPGTLALFGLGVAPIAVAIRRRRK